MFARAMTSVAIIKTGWRSCTRTSRDDRWSRNEGSKFKLGQSLTKWLTVVTDEKLREWIQNHPPVQVPSLNVPERLFWILTNRGLWITVHHCAKRKKTSIICVADLHSLPWNITSKAHKIRTTLKRRWIFKRASGDRCLHDAGKTRLPRKAAVAAAAAAATPRQYIRGQSPATEKKTILREERIWSKISGWQTCKKTFLRDYHLQVCLLRHKDRRHSEEARATYWDVTHPVLRRRECTKSQINWRENSRVRVGRIAFTAEASNLENGRYSCDPKTISGLFHQEWRITQRFSTRVQFSYPVDRARDHYSITEAGLGAKRKERKENVRDVHSRTEGKQTVPFLYNGRCAICFDNNASEAEVITVTERTPTFVKHASGKPKVTFQTWNFDPIPSESRDWLDESYKDKQYTKRIKDSQAWCSAVTDASFHCQRVHQKDQQEDIHMCRFLIASK